MLVACLTLNCTLGLICLPIHLNILELKQEKAATARGNENIISGQPDFGCS